MFVDESFHLNDHLSQLIDEYEQNANKVKFNPTDMIWGRLKGMRLNVYTIGVLHASSGTMTVTNVEFNSCEVASGKKGIRRFRLEVDKRFWEERRICYLEFVQDRKQTAVVVEGPGEPILVNAYIVHMRNG